MMIQHLLKHIFTTRTTMLAASVGACLATGIGWWNGVTGSPSPSRSGEAQPTVLATPSASKMVAFPIPAAQNADYCVSAESAAEPPTQEIQLCQALGPAAPYCITGVDSADANGCGEMQWQHMRNIPWQVFAQGEYVGPHRFEHTPEYRIRVDDQIDFIYRLTREMSNHPYELNVGDEVRIESLTDEKIDRILVIQPDGTITLRLLGQVQAARRTVEELRADLEQRYLKYYNVPAITVTPLKVNTRLEDLRATVDARAGQGGQSRQVRVSPDGTVQLPGLGSIPSVGLTLGELKREVDERYSQVVDGIEVTPTLQERAPRRLFVVGEVAQPGVYAMEGPTTVMMAISQAGGWNIGGNLREVVVFRRAEDWRLLATRIDIRGALYGNSPTPADEIWLRDSDVVVVPKSPIQVADDFIELVFTRGIYGVFPFQGAAINFAKASSL